MYIGFINDRQELGFTTIKDIHAVKQLSNLKSTLAIPGTWMVKKGKQTIILIFSKEVLVAVFIFVQSISVNIDPDVYCPSSSSPEVYQSFISKSDNLVLKESLKSPSPILDSILKLNGGSDDLNDKEMEKLVKSIAAKTPQSSDKEISINKFLKKILKLIDPVISDQRFWRIISESEKSELSGPSEVRSTDILGPVQNVPENQPKIGSQKSSIFAEAFPVKPVQKRRNIRLPMTENNDISEGLTPSGLSGNHEELSENIQLIERLTRLRRAQPLYPSEVLGDSFQYSQQQLERKAPRHLTEDYNISIEGKTKKEQGLAYLHEVEEMLKTPNLIVREDGMMNQQEPAIICFDPDSKFFASFENNPLYENNHFISSYEIDDNAVTEFFTTGNIGESRETRKAKIDQDQRLKAAQERRRDNEKSFYQTLPEDARIGNKQLREAEALNQKLKEDPKFQLTDNDKNLIQRAEKHQQHKLDFDKNNPHISEDEL